MLIKLRFFMRMVLPYLLPSWRRAFRHIPELFGTITGAGMNWKVVRHGSTGSRSDERIVSLPSIKVWLNGLVSSYECRMTGLAVLQTSFVIRAPTERRRTCRARQARELFAWLISVPKKI